MRSLRRVRIAALGKALTLLIRGMRIRQEIPRMRCAAIFAALLAASVHGEQPSKPNRDPDAARLVTSDIPAFWKVFENASLKDSAEMFQREYIETGSAGLHDFLKSRIQNGRALAGTVAARASYYAAIRENTLAVDQNPAIRRPFGRAFGN